MTVAAEIEYHEDGAIFCLPEEAEYMLLMARVQAQGPLSGEGRMCISQMQQSPEEVMQRRFIGPWDGITVKKGQSFMIGQFLSAVHQKESRPCAGEYRQRHGHITVFFVLGTIP